MNFLERIEFYEIEELSYDLAAHQAWIVLLSNHKKHQVF